jgi:hypothetical protein
MENLSLCAASIGHSRLSFAVSAHASGSSPNKQPKKEFSVSSVKTNGNDIKMNVLCLKFIYVRT